MATNERAQARIGRVLKDKYRIVALVGEGAMATVYRAEQTEGGPDVAVKVFDPPLYMDPEKVETRQMRFRREARLIRKLDHPNIVRMLDFGVAPGGLQFMVLELLEGENLLEHVRRRDALDLGLVAHVGREVCRSLAVAHGQGMIHRDLKPENIVLCSGRKGELPGVKVVDFGAARMLDPDEMLQLLTAADTTIGSAPYMSPEQARTAELTAATDMYSLGITLYEALTGTLPFKGNFVELMSMHSFAVPPPLALAGVDDELVAAWQRLLDRLLAKEPQARPQDAGALVADFDALASIADGGVPRRRRSRWPVVLAVAGAVIVAVGAVMFFLLRGG